MKNINESGRSMVEMLGVLAIIGVLSIGGIAGYSRAMKNWRANEVLDAASRVAAMVETEVAADQSLTYNQMVGDTTHTSAGTGKVASLAGGIVSQITAYGIAASSNPGKVVVTLTSGSGDIVDNIKEKLGCTTGTCKISKSIELDISAAS